VLRSLGNGRAGMLSRLAPGAYASRWSEPPSEPCGDRSRILPVANRDRIGGPKFVRSPNLEQVIPCSWNPNQVLEIAAGNVRLDVLAD
jgi:hypothetical protein